MKQDHRYTLDFRVAEAHQVMGWIKAGLSGCIVALRGAGRSSFLRFLSRQDVRQHYLGPDYRDYSFFVVDLLALTEYSDWAFCELVLDRLVGQLDTLGTAQVAEEVAALQHEAVRSKDMLLAYRAMERCIEALCRQPARRVVLLFNEFDAAFQTMNPHVFQWLRSIRESCVDQVVYIVVVTRDLRLVRPNIAEVEPFYTLVGYNVCYLGPLNEEGTRQRIYYLASQRSADLDAEDVERILDLCGGHTGLLKAILGQLWDRHRGSDWAELALLLQDAPEVRTECLRIWGSLSEREQAAAGALVTGLQADPDMLDLLKLRGVVKAGQSGDTLFSSLLADFVRQQPLPVAARTVVHRSPRLVQIDGRRIEGLTDLEFELLCYLYEHRGHVCTKDDLVKNVFQQQFAQEMGGIDDARLHTLVSRLRSKIQPPPCIVTIRGEGYKFVEPEAP